MPLLDSKRTLELTPSSPFNFDATFHKPDHFTTGDNFWQPGVRWQTWNHQNTPLGLKFQNAGTTDNPKIELTVFSQKPLSLKSQKELINEITYRYNLALDLSGFYSYFKDDPLFSPILTTWRGMRPGHPSSLYEYLIIGIVLQNASVRRSIQMFQNLLQSYGTLLEFDGHKLFCFWSPGRLQTATEDELRALKVGYRARSIKKIDDYFHSGQIDEAKMRLQNLEFQRLELLKLYGVGPATVWYLLFDVFHHWDFFNHISPWEQKIYSKIFFNVEPETPVSVEKLLKHFRRFGPYKQLAVHYLWEDLWWQRTAQKIDWLEKLIRV